MTVTSSNADSEPVAMTAASVNSDTLRLDTILLDSETVDEEVEEGNSDEENFGGVFQILDNLENGEIDESLPRTGAEAHQENSNFS